MGAGVSGRVVSFQSVGLVVAGGGGATPGPTVNTGATSGKSDSTVTLNGDVTGLGLPTTYWFQYGTNANALSSSTPTGSTSAVGKVLFSAQVIGLASGTTYYYRAIASNSAGVVTGQIRSFTTDVRDFMQFPFGMSAPWLVTLGVINITATSAELRGAIDPNSLTALGWFQYRAVGSSTWIETTPKQSMGNGTTPVSISAAITGLTDETQYEFRVAASNNLAPNGVFGATMTFLTNAGAGSAPTVVTNAATNIGTNAATLNGTVNPGGADPENATTAYYEYGTSPGVYTLQSQTYDIEPGGAPVSLPVAVLSLAANTTYYFRLRAFNSYGDATPGAELSFTTLVVTANKPTCVILTPASVGENTAVLQCQSNPNGFATNVTIEITPWPGSTWSATPQSPEAIGAGSSAITVAHVVSGLTASSTYAVRAYATNANGTTNSSELVFSTAGPGGGFGVGTQNPDGYCAYHNTYADPLDPASGEVTDLNPPIYRMDAGQYVQQWSLDQRAPYSANNPFVSGPQEIGDQYGISNFHLGVLWTSLPWEFTLGKTPLTAVAIHARIGDYVGLSQGSWGGIGFGDPSGGGQVAWPNNKPVTGITFCPLDTAEPNPIIDGLGWYDNFGGANNVRFVECDVTQASAGDNTASIVNQEAFLGARVYDSCRWYPKAGTQNFGYGWKWAERGQGSCRALWFNCTLRAAQEHIWYYDSLNAQNSGGSASSGSYFVGCNNKFDAQGGANGAFQGGDSKASAQMVNRSLEPQGTVPPPGQTGESVIMFKSCDLVTNALGNSACYKVVGHKGHVIFDGCTGFTTDRFITVEVDGPLCGNGTWVHDDQDGLGPYITQRVTIKNCTVNAAPMTSDAGAFCLAGVKLTDLYESNSITNLGANGTYGVELNSKFSYTSWLPQCGYPIPNTPNNAASAAYGVVFHTAGNPSGAALWNGNTTRRIRNRRGEPDEYVYTTSDIDTLFHNAGP